MPEAQTEQAPFKIWRGDDAILIRFANGESAVLTTREAIALGEALVGARPVRRRAETDASITEMYTAGLAVRDIAATLGLTRGTISTTITRLGIANRKPASQARMRAMQAGKRAA